MQEGDRIRVITGEHQGKTGKVIGPFIAGGLGTIGDKALKDLKGRWFIQLDESGEQDILKEEELEVIK